MTDKYETANMDSKKYPPSETYGKDHEIGVTRAIVDKAAERAYGTKNFYNNGRSKLRTQQSVNWTYTSYHF